jgi:hypothetical protein
MLHVSDGNTIYWEHAFGPARRQFSDLVPHGDAAGAIAYLAESQRPLTAIVAEIDDGRLDELRPTPWGEWWPAGRVLVVLLDEQVHQGAEIALLRTCTVLSHAERGGGVTTERRNRMTESPRAQRRPAQIGMSISFTSSGAPISDGTRTVSGSVPVLRGVPARVGTGRGGLGCSAEVGVVAVVGQPRGCVRRLVSETVRVSDVRFGAERRG